LKLAHAPNNDVITFGMYELSSSPFIQRQMMSKLEYKTTRLPFKMRLCTFLVLKKKKIPLKHL